jgi:hypothetical protein
VVTVVADWLGQLFAGIILLKFGLVTIGQTDKAKMIWQAFSVNSAQRNYQPIRLGILEF